jgi:electron transport complex protein RnfG
VREFINLVLRLFVVCAVAAGLLGVTYSVTKEPIAVQAKLASDRANQAVFAEATGFDEANMDEYRSQPGWNDSFEAVTQVFIAKKDGDTIGYVLKVVGSGYGGDIGMTVGVDAEGKYTGVTIDSHSETPGLGANAVKDDFRSQYTGKSSAETLNVIKSGAPADTDIQAIAGATITSRAVTDAINAGGAFAQAFLIDA